MGVFIFFVGVLGQKSHEFYQQLIALQNCRNSVNGKGQLFCRYRSGRACGCDRRIYEEYVVYADIACRWLLRSSFHRYATLAEILSREEAEGVRHIGCKLVGADRSAGSVAEGVVVGRGIA